MHIQEYFTEPLVELEHGIYRSQKTGKLEGYDSISKFYDIVVGSRIYNKVLWGNSITDYKKFTAEAVQSAGSVILDAGCGSLNFTLEAYLKTKRSIILIDSSIEMLRICKKKLDSSGKLGKSIFCLQADILNLSLKPASIDTIISMGMMHLFNDEQVRALMKEFDGILKEPGSLYLSSLCPENSFPKKYINWLHSKGEVAEPRAKQKMTELILSSISDNVIDYYKGSMFYQCVTRV
jgi:ubiquinone/menaquinone biosynthesis C-methylase UbiE